MIFLLPLMFIVPEDSNCQDLLDKQLAHYFVDWEMSFDSVPGGMRTSQGCLDLRNWYIDLNTKFEVSFCKVMGLRYRNEYFSYYDNHFKNHRFEPYFQIRDNLRFLFTVTTHYYKGEDELGIGFFIGKDYLNYLELFVIAEDFDRNFSLQHVPPTRDKITYWQHPIKLVAKLNKYWKTGHLALQANVSNRYLLQSNEMDFVDIPYFQEKALHRYFYGRAWQDIGKFRIGGICDLRQAEFFCQDTASEFSNDKYEIVVEPAISFRISDKWIPNLYFTYNYKTHNDLLDSRDSGTDSLFNYQRDVYAYLLDIEFRPGGNFVWHAGIQREFYYNNQGREYTERRLLLGFEYRYKNVWFYFVEAMEGDFPTPKWMHNHTYIQLMVRF